eukprot:1906190-Alexandrium_andersonii.AAC.1
MKVAGRRGSPRAGTSNAGSPTSLWPSNTWKSDTHTSTQQYLSVEVSGSCFGPCRGTSRPSPGHVS